MTGLLITLLLGVFILLGGILVFFTKQKEKFNHFIISVSFGVLASLLLLELLPETYEILTEEFSLWGTIVLFVIFILLGSVILKVIDRFIPHHGHDHKAQNYLHIGLISTIALCIHNIVEGASVIGVFEHDTAAGLMLTAGIALHNIPLGMVVASSFYEVTKSKWKTILYLLPFVLSTFVGGLLLYINIDLVASELAEGFLLLISSGMLLYLLIFELFPHMKHGNKKRNALGVILGIILIIIAIYFTGGDSH